MKTVAEAVIWHDVECGAYEADLETWAGLAGAARGPVLELGCGTGRVGLHLARRHGFEVIGLDSETELVAAFNDRARDVEQAHALVADARDFALGREFALIVAPMQVVQLLGDRPERRRCLEAVRRHLRPGGLAAFAIVDEMPVPEPGPPPLPDVRDLDGWVYSSLPLDAIAADGAIAVRRLRQTVSPQGELSEALDELRLTALSAAGLEREAAATGLTPAGRREVVATDAHVGSTVVLLESSA